MILLEKFVSASGEKAKRAQNFEELYAKFNELKGKRLNYKDKLVRKSLKNRMQKKTKKEERLMQKKHARVETMAADKTPKIKEETDVPKVPKQKPIFNSKGNMVFSKFDFAEIGTKKKLEKTEKDPRKILKQLEEKKNKVKELEELGEKEKAVEIKEKDAWKTVLAKASGEKVCFLKDVLFLVKFFHTIRRSITYNHLILQVKNDPELLKKTIKREEQKKKHSQQKWESRKQAVQKAVQDRQEKRSENIMKRKKEVKTNKLKKAAKKGRIIPGF